MLQDFQSSSLVQLRDVLSQIQSKIIHGKILSSVVILELHANIVCSKLEELSDGALVFEVKTRERISESEFL